MHSLDEAVSRKWLLHPFPSAEKLGGDLRPSADPSTGKTLALHFPIPVLKKGCSSMYASASAGIILQKPFLTTVFLPS